MTLTVLTPSKEVPSKQRHKKVPSENKQRGGMSLSSFHLCAKSPHRMVAPLTSVIPDDSSSSQLCLSLLTVFIRESTG